MKDELFLLVSEIIKPVVKLDFQKRNNYLKSKIGGLPTLYQPDIPPICEHCNCSQTFIAELDINEFNLNEQLGNDIFSFFICFNCIGDWWGDEGPLGYKILMSEKNNKIFNKYVLNNVLPEVNFNGVSGNSLPSWDNLSYFSEKIIQTSSKENPDEPWELYDNYYEDINEATGYDCQIGGYPQFFETSNIPKCKCCSKQMILILQVYSEKINILEFIGASSLYFFMCVEHNTSTALLYQSE